MSFTPKATTTAAALFGGVAIVAIVLSLPLSGDDPPKEPPSGAEGPPGPPLDDIPLQAARPDGQVAAPRPVAGAAGQRESDESEARGSSDTGDEDGTDAPPPLADPRPSLTGPEAVRAVMETKELELRACYRQAEPPVHLEEPIELGVKVAADGSVTEAMIPWEAGPEGVRRCLTAVLRRIRFASARKAREIRYPFDTSEPLAPESTAPGAE